MTLLDRLNNSQGFRGAFIKPAPEALLVHIQTHVDAIRNLAALYHFESDVGEPEVAANFRSYLVLVTDNLRHLRRQAYLLPFKEPPNGPSHPRPRRG